MKKIITLIFTLWLALTATAQTPVDTVAVLKDAKNVTLTSTEQGVNLLIRNDKGGLTYRYNTQNTSVDSVKEDDDWNLEPVFLNKQKRKKYATICGSLYGGYTWLYDAPEGINHGAEVGFKDLCAFQWRPTDYTYLSIGFGWQMNWYYLKKGMILDQQNHNLLIKAAEEGMAKTEGEIFMTSLLLPVTYTQKISGDFGFSISAIANFWPFLKHANTSYQRDGYKYKESFKHLETNFITPEFMFTMGWVGSFGVYVKYNPCSRFRDGYGPQFKALSVGASLVF